MNPIISVAIQQLPGILALIRAMHAKANPDAPAVTDDDIVAALQSAIAQSVAKDQEWLAAHPPTS